MPLCTPFSVLYLELQVQFSSVAQSCPTLCDPMNRSTPGLPVHHQLLEFTQTRTTGYTERNKERWHRSSFLLLFSCWVMSDSLPPHVRLPCPSPSPGAYSNLRPLSLWCHPNILSCVLFSSCLQSFLASGSFLMSHLFASGSQNIGVSTLVLPMNI